MKVPPAWFSHMLHALWLSTHPAACSKRLYSLRSFNDSPFISAKLTLPLD